MDVCRQVNHVHLCFHSLFLSHFLNPINYSNTLCVCVKKACMKKKIINRNHKYEQDAYQINETTTRVSHCSSVIMNDKSLKFMAFGLLRRSAKAPKQWQQWMPHVVQFLLQQSKSSYMKKCLQPRLSIPCHFHSH